jgi:ABC-2 type transport system permease protein
MKTTFRQFRTVLAHELAGHFRQKAMMAVTLLLVIALGVVLNWPRLSALWQHENRDSGPRQTLAVAPGLAYHADVVIPIFSAAFPDRDIIPIVAPPLSSDIRSVEERVGQGMYDAAVVITGLQSYHYIVSDTTLFDMTEHVVRELMVELYRAHRLAEANVSPEDIAGIMAPAIRGETVQTGIDQSENFFYTYIMIFLLYMAILLYGQVVAMGVVEEKSSRAMELLITSAKPPALLFGKVIAAGLSGLFQLTVILSAGLIFYRMNQAAWAENEIIRMVFNIPPSLLGYMVLFFVLGFFVYAFLYGALASLCSRTEEVSAMTMPVTFLFIGFFFATFYAMMTDAAGALMGVLSYIPFSAPMAMFVRAAMTRVLWWEVTLSVGILLGSMIFIGWLAAKIYRLGVLLYGKPPKPGEILKMLRVKQ